MKLQLRSCSLGASHHLQAWCALVAPQAPGLELSHPNYNLTIPLRPPIRSVTDSPSLSHRRQHR